MKWFSFFAVTQDTCFDVNIQSETEKEAIENFYALNPKAKIVQIKGAEQ